MRSTLYADYVRACSCVHVGVLTRWRTIIEIPSLKSGQIFQYSEKNACFVDARICGAYSCVDP